MAHSHDNPAMNDDLDPEHNFRSLKSVVRGKYATRYQERLRVVRLAADLSPSFPDEEAVNAALRQYLDWQQQRATPDQN